MSSTMFGRKLKDLQTLIIKIAFDSLRHSYALVTIEERDYDWNKNIDDLRNERLRC